ncbi:MAG: hydroxyethylthiazole kinase [Gammaproteobacteria bacterium]|nr:hydroxyethylthiazole kinase [Gammaproteobacteria bacterium]
MLEKLKSHNPLILNITNMVTMDFIANGLLSLGASPIMSLAEEEMDDLCKISHAVVVNIGTLNAEFINLALSAGQFANQHGKPLIFDPVGVGASLYRTQSAQELLNTIKIDVIRGNASEILALSGLFVVTKGVDSTVESQQAVEAGKLLSQKYNCIVVISGKADVIIENNNIDISDFGSPLMSTVTGMGCLLSSVVAAFRAVESNRFEAAKHAVRFYGQCGEIAAAKSHIPAHFKNYFLEALYAHIYSPVCA